MKRTICVLALLILASSTYLASFAQESDPSARTQGRPAMVGTAPSGNVQSLGDSQVTFAPEQGGASCYNPGSVQTFCFKAESRSVDEEYVYFLWQRFPEGWTIEDVHVSGTPVCADPSGSFGSFSWAAGNTPNEVQIDHARYMDETDDCTAYYCFDVTVGSTVLHAPVSWYWSGDDYGQPPYHPCSADGYTPDGDWDACDQMTNPPAAIPPCTLDPGVYLMPITQNSFACGGQDASYLLSLFNYTGSSGVFDITYDSVFPVVGPSRVWADDGQSVQFWVQVTAPCAGVEDTVVVTAFGCGYTAQASASTSTEVTGWQERVPTRQPAMDGAVISYGGELYLVGGYGTAGTVQIYDGSFWREGASNGIDSYISDACLGFDGSGKPVIDVIGTFDNEDPYPNTLRYDIDADAWSTLPLPSGMDAPIWAPDIVSMAEHTGQNVCYISGGAESPGGGTMNSLLAYNPASRAVQDLGDFSYSALGVDSHASWYVPWVGEAGSICIAGGVDAENQVYAESQCYDLASHSFRGVNADLGPLPEPWWAAADASLVLNGEDQIWLYNGADATFNILQKSAFARPGSGFSYGEDPEYAVYRLEGDAYDGTVWAAGGSIGGFNQSDQVESLRRCQECLPLAPLADAYVAIDSPNSVAVIDTTTNTVIESGIDWPNLPLVGALTPNRELLYVAGEGQGPISALHTRNYEIAGTIELQGSDQRGMAISDDGTRLYVSDYADMSVTVADLQRGSVVTAIALAGHPEEIALSADQTRLYVAANNPDTNYAIDTLDNEIVSTFSAGNMPRGMAASEDGQWIFVANNDGHVTVIAADDYGLSKTLPAGNGASHIVKLPNGSKLYVMNFNASTVSVIDALDLETIKTISLPSQPNGGATTWDGSRLYVALANGRVAVIDTVTDAVGGSIYVGGNAKDVMIGMAIPVRASFSAYPQSGVVPLEVSFANRSTGDFDTSLWTFGDGSTSTEESPVHTYAQKGRYTVSLTVSGPGGTNTLTKTHYIYAGLGTVYLSVVMRTH